MSDARTILVCHADEATRSFLAENLTADRYETSTAAALAEAQLKIDHNSPSLAICGPLGGPAGQLRFLRWLAEERISQAPVTIALVDARDELALLRCFEARADDVLGEPLSYPELRARVRARLTPRSRPVALRAGPLTVDPAAREVRIAGRKLAVTRLEFGLLVRLAADPGVVVSKVTLLREVWGYRLPARTRSVDAHACRLRRKLADAGMAGVIDNVRGVGYRLVVGSGQPARGQATGNGRAALAPVASEAPETARPQALRSRERAA